MVILYWVKPHTHTVRRIAYFGHRGLALLETHLEGQRSRIDDTKFKFPVHAIVYVNLQNHIWLGFVASDCMTDWATIKQHGEANKKTKRSHRAQS